MIPTSPSGPPRGGGEVGITQAERSDRVLPGWRGCRAGIAACHPLCERLRHYAMDIRPLGGNFAGRCGSGRVRHCRSRPRAWRARPGPASRRAPRRSRGAACARPASWCASQAAWSACPARARVWSRSASAALTTGRLQLSLRDCGLPLLLDRSNACGCVLAGFHGGGIAVAVGGGAGCVRPIGADLRGHFLRSGVRFDAPLVSLCHLLLRGRGVGLRSGSALLGAGGGLPACRRASAECQCLLVDYCEEMARRHELRGGWVAVESEGSAGCGLTA